MQDLTGTWVGYACLFGFLLAYGVVVLEEKIHMRKSKPVILMGCLMWMAIGTYEALHGGGKAHAFVTDLIAEIGGLFFFLLSAMTYIITLEERNAFKCLRAKLLGMGMGFRQLFWATGAIAFFLSPVADNLTTALLLSTVALAVSGGNGKFIVPTFVSIVVGANAGGAWSPFGDITTLMVWTSRKVGTFQFLYLFIPSVINWVVPALMMHPFIPKEPPQAETEKVELKPGAKFIIFLGFLTISIAVCFHQFLHLPPFLGMMLGLSLLMIKGYHLKMWGEKRWLQSQGVEYDRRSHSRFNIFQKVGSVEFDTLLFFFGVLTAVGALQYLGYLALVSQGLYGPLGATTANVLIGVISAVVDNIPVMYAVLKMDPAMGLDQWLLVTMTAGVGGSMLSIGSAAGVGAMGVCREHYTFLAHLKWAPVIVVGYAASILAWWVVTAGLR
ncbi:MAG: sodium:proton antiporter NhaD [Nitrospinae bacterium]|nr:sodium:proton antiporter NhaD [Nitrospinota bacterium]